MSQKRFETIFFLSVLILSTVLTLLVFRPYLTLLAFGGVLAIVTRPLYRKLHRLFRSEVSAAFLTVLFVAVVILLPLSFFLAALAGEMVGVFAGLRGQLTTFNMPEYLAGILPQSLHSQIPRLMEQALGLASGVAQSLSSNLIGLFSNAFSIMFGFLIMLISVYYLLKDGSRIKKKLLAVSPLADEYDEIMFSRISVAVRAVMGVSLTTVPAAAYLLLSGHLAAGIGLLAVSVAIIGTVDNFLQPKLVENKTKIHPLLILLSILGGLKFYGFSGFILGPLTLSITLALYDIYEKQFRDVVMGRVSSESELPVKDGQISI